jgi:mRNA-degrading endonuclease RelE of RelBE toxin-antitoxin system
MLACRKDTIPMETLATMTYLIKFLIKAEKYLLKLDQKNYDLIEESVEELKRNPYRNRPHADIRKLSGFKSPAMYRLRVGRHRLEYFVEDADKTIYFTDAFPRSGNSDYR